MTFEEYLIQKHGIEEPTILDDDMPDAFENWKMELEAHKWIEYAELWHIDEVISNLEEDIKKLKEINSK